MKTFIWKNIKEWQGDIEEMIPEGIRGEFIGKIQEYKDKFKYVDELDLFKRLYSEFGDYSGLEEIFVNTFPLRFPLIRMYHCCRPSDTGSYYSKGICVLNSNEADTRFRKLFLKNPSFPQVSESHIEKAILSMGDSRHSRHCYVYFGIDDRFLIECCRHYLVYGSEYVQGLTAFLHRKLGCNAESELKKIGKPTVFEVNMPVGKISKDEMVELGEDVFPAWSFAVAHDMIETGKVDFSIEIQAGLQPEFIVGHYHPDLPDD